MNGALAAVVVVPVAGAALVFLAPPGWRRRPGIAAAAATVAATFAAVAQVHTHGTLDHAVGGWPAPVGIQLHADGLAGVFLAMTGVVGALVSWYAAAAFAGEGRRAGPEEDAFWPQWLLLWGALNAIYVSADAFNLYVCMEIMGLAAVALVVLTRGRAVLQAGLRYLLAAILGSFAYLLGVALLYAQFGTLALPELAQRAEPGPAATAALVVITVGLALKTGVFPLHFWLPPAHSSALAPVSAALSGLVVKASYFLLLRFWLDVLAPVVTPAAAALLGLAGLAAVTWGSIQALSTDRLKLLVAHSTVAQVGFLLLVFPLAAGDGPGAAAAVAGAAYYAAAHGIAKAAMFLAAGTVTRAVGHDRIPDLVGIGVLLPRAMFAFGIGAVSLVGLPPTGGFVGKWLLLTGAIEGDRWLWAVAIAASGLLTAAYTLRIARVAFGTPAVAAPGAVPGGLHAVPLLLAAGTVALGLAAAGPLELLTAGGFGGTP